MAVKKKKRAAKRHLAKRAVKRPAKRKASPKRARRNPTYPAEKVRTVRLSPYRRGAGPTFTLELWDLQTTDSAGRYGVGYKLTEKRPGQKRARTLFECKSPPCAVYAHLAVDSDAMVLDVIRWLTLKPGDTDAEWFANYTKDQLDFANSDAEALQVTAEDRFGARENPWYGPPRRPRGRGRKPRSGWVGEPRGPHHPELGWQPEPKSGWIGKPHRSRTVPRAWERPERQRVELSPATDAWMQGDRYGEVIGEISRGPRKGFLKVRMDKSGRVLVVSPEYIQQYLENPWVGPARRRHRPELGWRRRPRQPAHPRRNPAHSGRIINLLQRVADDPTADYRRVPAFKEAERDGLVTLYPGERRGETIAMLTEKGERALDEVYENPRADIVLTENRITNELRAQGITPAGKRFLRSHPHRTRAEVSELVREAQREGLVCGMHGMYRRNPVKNPRVSGEQLFEQALARVESESIRQWATTGKNRTIWLEMAQAAAKKGQTDPDLFAAYIVTTAMG
jgi:hypothetical protein